MQNVKLRLDAWRDAERRRDALERGSSEWQEADEEVRRAEKVFHAEFAQASARYAEEESETRNPRLFLQVGRRTSSAGN